MERLEKNMNGVGVVLIESSKMVTLVLINKDGEAKSAVAKGVENPSNWVMSEELRNLIDN